MSIQTQICGCVLLSVILLMILVQPRVRVQSQIVFRISLLVAIINIMLDGGSLLLIQDFYRFPSFLVYTVCKVYLFSLVGVGLCSFLYITVESGQRLSGLRNAVFLFSGIIMLTIGILPIYINNRNGNLFTYGPAVIATYIGAGIIILLDSIILAVSADVMNPRRWVVCVIWIGIWVGATLIQFLNNNLLVVGYAQALGIVILFIKMENPESFMDRTTGLFNDQTMRLMLERRFEKGDTVAMLRINFENVSVKDELLSRRARDILSKNLASVFLIYSDDVYKHAGWEYTLLFENSDEMYMASTSLQNRFLTMWEIEGTEIDLKPTFVEIADDLQIEDTDVLLETIQLFLIDCKKHSSNSKVLNMNRQWVVKQSEQKQTADMIAEAIEQDRITIFFQPIYSTKEKKFTSAEVLARIIDKEGQVIPPYKFIPVAEKNGMIVDIGEIVFKKACAFYCNNQLEQYGIQFLEVNLSAMQCARADLAQRFIRILESNRLAPEKINLEITESAAMQSKNLLLQNMETLIDKGITFSLDDFGTGYSNLSYIMELPIEVVKFDREMTNAYFDSEKGRPIMDASIQMIQKLKLKIVAEGVEEKSQLEALEALGIDYIQGFYFSKPIPGNEFIELLEKKNN